MELHIEGLRSISASQAREIVEDQWRTIEEFGLTSSMADDTAFLLRLGLLRLGLPEAQVDWQILGGGRVLRLEVEEGTQLLINRVRIRGEQIWDSDDLRPIVTADTAERQRFFQFERMPFVRDDIEAGVARLQEFLRLQGYLQATVEWNERRAPNTPPGEIEVVVNLVEGPLYHAGPVRVEDAAGRLRPEDTARLAHLSGKAYSEDVLREAQILLSTHYSKLGHYLAEVEVLDPSPEEVATGTVLPLRVMMEPGDVYEVKNIVIEGTRRIPAVYVDRRMRQLEDQPYDHDAVDQAFDELARSGLFSVIEIEPRITGPGTMDLVVEVEEGKFRSLGVYGGYGTYDGAILGFTYSNHDFLRTHRTLRSRLEYNSRGYEGEFTYLLPRIFGTRWNSQASLFALTREFEGYSKFDAGLRGEAARELGKHLRVTLFAETRHTEIRDSDFSQATDIGPTSYWTNSTGVSVLWDHRDSPVLPKLGYFLEGSFSGGGAFLGGDFSFLRAHVQYSHYWSWGRHRLRAGARAGIIAPLEGADAVPIDLRYFSGGSTTVRSFRQRQMGMDDPVSGDPLGGEFYGVANLEYGFEVITNLELAVFLDAGNIQEDYEDAGFEDMHYAAGLGFRLNLPVGPLRVDYGWNLNEGKGEPTGAFHLSFGFAF
ncbi:MAG TPA: BamA/TamA family outer membrane protein [Verrucomicrobiales bacterium]|nr:BamA/TamA family outer membrane protein [Verrucomicrobiales bacterium]